MKLFILVSWLFIAGAFYASAQPFSLTGAQEHTWLDVVTNVFKNQDIYNAFISSKEVTVQRLHSRPINFGNLKDYDKEATVLMGSNEAQKIKELLMKPSSYPWDGLDVNCIPDYAVLFSFHSDKRTVRVAFCFQCGQFGVFDGGDDNAVQINDVDMFSPMRKQVLAICKEIFPNDKEIQGLQ